MAKTKTPSDEAPKEVTVKAKKAATKANVSVDQQKKRMAKQQADRKPCTKVKLSKKEAMAQWSPDTLHETTSRLLKSTMDQFAAEYGDPFIAAAGEAGRIVIGIQVPFAFEYLIQNSVFPLSRMSSIVGKTHCNKSAFTYEMIRWLRPYAGQGYILENESKASTDLANSVIGYEDEVKVTPWGLTPTYSVEDWQEKLQRLTDRLRSHWTKESTDNPYPPGRIYPVFIVLDSIMGKLSQETQEKIEEKGYSERAFAVEALKITSFLKKYPQDIAAWPIHFIGVNHVKPQKAENGHHMERRKAGGVHIDFQQTFEIELSRRQKIKKVDTSNDGGFEIGGNMINMRCYKNGLGEDQHEIVVPIVWYHKRSPVTGDIRQYTHWDWDTACVDLLLSFDEGSKKEKIREIVDIHQVKGVKFYSKALDIQQSEPVEKSDIGRAITRNLPIRNALRDMFGIKRRKTFKKGVDYLEQIGVLKADIESGMDD